MRRTFLLLFLMLLCTLTIVSCQRQTPAERKAIFDKQINELMATPSKALGENRSSVQSKLGAPISITTEQIKNVHDAHQTDLIHTLSYKGLDVVIYDVVTFKKEMLLSVRMNANYPKTLPALIGQDEKSIKTKFGDPTRINGQTFEYDSGDERVQIEFSNSSVTAVQWNLYVD